MWQKEREPPDDHLGKPSSKANVCNTDALNARFASGLRGHLIQLPSCKDGKLSHSKSHLPKASQCVNDKLEHLRSPFSIHWKVC